VPGWRTRPGWGLELSQPGVAAIAVAILAHSAWRATGARAAYLVEFGTIAALVANLVWAMLVVGRTTVTIRRSPSDAVVGDTPPLDIDVRGPARTVQLRLASSPGAPPVRATPPETGALPSLAAFRGVAVAAVVEILWRGPLGLVGCSRRRWLRLPRPLYIGPRPIAVADVVFPSWAASGADGGGGPLGPGDIVRGVRDYVPGDPRRLVHWPASARAGTLVVKEVELAPAPAVTIVADLNPGGPVADEIAGRAVWLCGHARRRGHSVVLVTCESGEVVAGAVDSMVAAHRRLATATAGAVHGPDGAPALIVHRDGTTWHSP
jgi:uncharacterized protein (DUF58 family)